MVCLEYFPQHEEKEMDTVYLGLGKKEKRGKKK